MKLIKLRNIKEKITRMGWTTNLWQVEKLLNRNCWKRKIKIKQHTRPEHVDPAEGRNERSGFQIVAEQGLGGQTGGWRKRSELMDCSMAILRRFFLVSFLSPSILRVWRYCWVYISPFCVKHLGAPTHKSHTSIHSLVAHTRIHKYTDRKKHWQRTNRADNKTQIMEQREE